MSAKRKHPKPEASKVTLAAEEVERLRAKEREACECLDRLKRVQADYENARKRLAREKEEFFLYANEDLISKFLPIMDNFDRALQQAGNTQDNSDAFIEGVRMIQKQFEGILTQSGLVQIESVGKLFDAQRHEALATIPSDTHPENTVVEEIQKGWFLRDRLLRPALVKVAVSATSAKPQGRQDEAGKPGEVDNKKIEEEPDNKKIEEEPKEKEHGEGNRN